MQNPYETLGVPVGASAQEILSAYRFYALKYHPQRNASQNTLPQFLQLTAAYYVLSNAECRAQYDRFALIDYTKTPPPTQQTALDLFSSIFGSTDPFACDFDVGMSDFGAFPGLNETKFRPRVYRTEKAGELRVDLFLKLEELYFGCQKKRQVRRKILNYDGTFYEKTEVIEINVQKGWKSNTEIKFKELGNEEVGVVPSDLIFVVKELPHSEFERRGDDLLIKVGINLVQALCGFTTEIKTLDGRALHVEMNEVVQNNGFKTVHGEGMPKVDGGFGDLRVEFQVEFPKHIPEDVKAQLKTLLEGL